MLQSLLSMLSEDIVTWLFFLIIYSPFASGQVFDYPSMAEICDYLSSEGLYSPEAPTSSLSLPEDLAPPGPPTVTNQSAGRVQLSQLVAKAAQDVLNGTLDGGHDVPLMMAGGS